MTYLEARRNRTTMAVLAFAVVIVISSFIFQEVTTTALDRIVRDVALAAIHAFGLILAVFLGVSVVSKEIDRRTVYLLVSKPISRGEYVFGKLLGVGLSLFVTLGLMTAAFLAQQLVYGAPIRPILLQTCWLIFMELMVIASFSVFASTFTSPIVSSFMALGLFLIGELASDIYLIGEQSKSVVFKSVMKAMFFIVPNFDRLNLKSQASVLRDAEAWTIASGTFYACCYVACFALAATAVFGRRDLK